MFLCCTFEKFCFLPLDNLKHLLFFLFHQIQKALPVDNAERRTYKNITINS